ncbi:hypothetical protein ACT7CZ_19155 [Bacillus cereus]
MVKLKPLFLSLSMITSLAVAGCSNGSAGTTKSNGKETTIVKLAIDTAAGGSFSLELPRNKDILRKMVLKLNYRILLMELIQLMRY